MLVRHDNRLYRFRREASDREALFQNAWRKTGIHENPRALCLY
jgi:hypothetical protein